MMSKVTFSKFFSFATIKINITLGIAIFLISLMTHFAYFNRQPVAIFDEVYFGKFANSYLTHEYFFDIHPPLGKLLIAGLVWPFQSKQVEFALNQKGYVTPNFAVYRFLPAFFGSLLALAIFVLALGLGIKSAGAFFAGFLVAIENSIIAHSRLILIDSMFLCFGFLGLWAYLKYRTTNKMSWLLLTGVLCGLSLAVKWVGLSFLGLVIIVEIIDLIKHKISIAKIKKILALLIGLPLIIYMLSFAIHFHLLTKNGPGDIFMSPTFQKTLNSDQPKQTTTGKLSFWSKFVELNRTMYKTNSAINTSHPYSSKWYSWPLAQKPIAYYSQNQQIIYFIPNLVIWLSGTVAVVITIIMLIMRPKQRIFSIYLLLGSFLMNWLIYSFISRTTFIYHYMAALLYAIIILAWLIERTKFSKQLFWIIGILATLNYLYYASQTYGL